MLIQITQVVPEIVEGVIDNMIVRITKLHRIVVPVEIEFDLATRSFFVGKPPVTVDALVTADVIGLQTPQEPGETGKDAEELALSKLNPGLNVQWDDRIFLPND